MRFLEKHSTSILGGTESPLTRGVLPVDISTVAEWHFARPQIEQSIREQFPCVIAPHPVTFFEYKLPLSWTVENPKTKAWERRSSGHGPSDYFGMLIVQEVLEPGYENPGLSDVLAGIQEDVEIRFKHYTFCFAGNANDRDVMFWAENYVDAGGRMIGGPIHSMDVRLLAQHNGNQAAAAAEAVSVYCTPVYLALTLIGSGAAPLREQAANKGDRRKAEKLGVPVLMYRRVDVSKLQSRSNREALEAARAAWDKTDKTAYGKPKESEKWLTDELKTYQFKIK